MTIRNLDIAFAPRSIAVVGASTDPKSVGYIVMANLRHAGFHGPIYPVNPHHTQIDGLKVYASVKALPSAPDLAVIATPPDTVAAIVADLAAAGGKGAVILTAGFGEGEDKAGQRRRTEILAAARPHNFRIIGPNCLGVLIPRYGLNGSFARTTPRDGQLALVSQSGAVTAALLDWAQPRNIGFSHVVTLGDMIDVDLGDMLDYLAMDAGTKAILLYIEGITQPRKFMSAARAAARLKPVLAVKSGRHAASAKVAASHTGALAGSDAVYDAVFKRSGILRIKDLEDLFEVATLLADNTSIAGRRLAIVTNGGGLGVLAADRLLDQGGELAPLTPDTIVALDAVLPKTWSRANPVDLIGDADSKRYTDAVALVLKDPTVDALLLMHCPTAITNPEEIALAVARQLDGTPHPKVLTAWLGEASVASARQTFSLHGIPSYTAPGEAVDSVMHMVRHQALMTTIKEVPPIEPEVSANGRAGVKAIVTSKTEPAWLSPFEAREVLRLYGIPCNRALKAATAEEAAVATQTLGGTVALKILSPDIIHKSDVGGVVLNLTATTVAPAAKALLEQVKLKVPTARIDGLIVEEMVIRPHARELLIGVTLDRTFGPIIAFGHGGTAVEVINDKALGLIPLNLALARTMIHDTRVGQLLAAYRSEAAADIAAVSQALVSLSQLVTDHPQIVDLDINPLLADASGILAVDVRIRVDPNRTVSTAVIKPYPREWERQRRLPDATELFIRPIKPQDERLVQEVMAGLVIPDIRLRFFAPVRDLQKSLLTRMTQIDYDREIVLLAGPNRVDAWAIAQFHANPDNTDAEFAIAVRSDQQNRRVGSELMATLIDIAKARGLQHISGLILAENLRMLSLCRRLGMKAESTEDAKVVRMVLPLSGDPTETKLH